MCKPRAEGKLVFTMPRRSHQSDKFQFILKGVEDIEKIISEAGAKVELVNLYDRSLNYKGCMSCFACKVKGGKKGICSFRDDLKPILEKALDADVLVCGSPVYCHYPSANFRAFMERLIFPVVNYSDFMHPLCSSPSIQPPSSR